ncbi:hypothetical protein SNE40_003019 [Patella caerulea]|uniref:Uncharacterized protein n=1 Tax=Patella caerulea TaxID=87958 RepID=A0AAN8KH49_PATCE
MYRRNGPPSRKEMETPRLELNVWREPREDGWEHTRVELMDLHDHHVHGINCGCFPKTSNSFIPSMIYDDVRCPHYENENLIQPGQQQMLAYPWTVQTYAPPRDLYGREARGSSKMSIGSFYRTPSVQSAPAKVLDRPTESASLKKRKPLPPFTAPDKRDRKFKPPASADSYKSQQRIAVTPNVTTADGDDYSIMNPEINDPDKPLVTQFDSVSQVATIGRHDFGDFKQPTDRKRRGPRLDRQFMLTPPRPALSTPDPRPNSITSSFKNSPRRIFTGQYVDPRSGHKYEYDIKYKKHNVQGNRKKVLAAF